VDIHEGGSQEPGTGRVKIFSLARMSDCFPLLVHEPFSVGSGVSHSLKEMVEAEQRYLQLLRLLLSKKIELILLGDRLFFQKLLVSLHKDCRKTTVSVLPQE
jgi:hypothetical protein